MQLMSSEGCVIRNFPIFFPLSFKVCVLGSREQLCIHPQVAKEQNNTTKVV